MNGFVSKAGVVLAAAVLAACGEKEDAGNPLRVGATPVPHAEILEQVKPVLAREGIELEVVTFTEYVQPNLALAADELDANYFQTIPYMESFNRDRGADLTTVARVHVEPMGLYSRRVKALAALPNGATIAVPSDPTNTGRALLLLQSAGLLKLRPNAGVDASVLDVAENPRGLKFSELESAQLPRALPDVDAAVINTNFALEAGLNPTRDALTIEGASSPYVNVLAVRGRADRGRARAGARPRAVRAGGAQVHRGALQGSGRSGACRRGVAPSGIATAGVQYLDHAPQVHAAQRLVGWGFVRRLIGVHSGAGCRVR